MRQQREVHKVSLSKSDIREFHESHMMELIKKALLLRREILLEDMLLTQANDPHVDRRVANLQGFCRGIDAIIDFDSLLNSLDSVVDIYDTGD